MNNAANTETEPFPANLPGAIDVADTTPKTAQKQPEKGQPKKEDKSDLKTNPFANFVKVFAVVGFLTILYIISLGVIKIIPKVNSVLTTAVQSLENKTGQKIGGLKFQPLIRTPFNDNSDVSLASTANIFANIGIGGANKDGANSGTNSDGSLIIESDPTSPDLTIKILDYGIIKSGRFLAEKTIKSTDNGAVRFEIKNNSNRDSSFWKFTASLPTSPSYIFTSEDLKPLVSGQKTTITLAFNNPDQDNNKISVRALPLSGLDSNIDNNIDSIKVNIVR